MHRCLFLLQLTLVTLAFVGPGHSQSTNLIDIGNGRKIYLECEGSGIPTVILVSGKGNRADTWQTTRREAGNPDASVFSRTAQFTRVCAYDRPETVGVNDEPSRSDPVPEPVSAKDGVSDLHALLSAAKIQGPYVIVGHSYGGLIARLYASTYPDAVAGLVLEDALSEGLYANLSNSQRDVLEAINLLPERVDTERSFAQVTAAPRVKPLPMIILTADLPPITAQDVASGALPSSVTLDFVKSLWSAQIAAQDALGKMFPAARRITNTNSQHYIHLQQPQIVVDAIRDVVAAVRSQGGK